MIDLYRRPHYTPSLVCIQICFLPSPSVLHGPIIPVLHLFKETRSLTAALANILISAKNRRVLYLSVAKGRPFVTSVHTICCACGRYVGARSAQRAERV